MVYVEGEQKLVVFGGSTIESELEELAIIDVNQYNPLKNSIQIY